MKKGLITLFTVAAFACMGVSYASAPTIQNLPDEVIIGDAEAPYVGYSGTDANWFVFTNAFNFENCVDDQDTPDANILWSFDEGDDAAGFTTGTKWFTVNGKDAVHVGSVEEADDATTPGIALHITPAAGKQLYSSGAGAFASFRDVVFSPTTSGWPFGSPTDPAKTRHANGKDVTFFASDGQNVTSATMTVKTIDQHADFVSVPAAFTSFKDDKFDTQVSGDWTFGGPTASLATNIAGDYASGAYRIKVMSLGNTAWHNAYWASNRNAWMPYQSISSDKYVRGKFYVYAANDTAQNWTALNQIPQLGLRIAYRFAAFAQQYVNPHEANTMDMSLELRPSTDPANPSIYRLDFDPVDVPYLDTFRNTSSLPEGIGGVVEVFDTFVGARGYVAMTELNLGTYPKSALATPKLTKTLNGVAANAGDLSPSDPADTLQAVHIIPAAGSIAVDGFPSPDTDTSHRITSTGTATGLQVSGSAVPATSIGDLAQDFTAKVGGVSAFSQRIRVDENELYRVRYHITSTAASNTQSQLWLGVRSIGYAYYTYHMFQGGAYGQQGGDGVRQMLPGASCLNPDKNSGDTTGGWYTVIQNTPMSLDIRADTAGATVAARMPLIGAAPARGTDSSSKRDLRVGFRAWDTITPGNPTAEVANFLIDQVVIEVFPQIAD